MSSLSDVVSLTITAGSVGISRAGFGVPLVLSANATSTARVTYYESTQDVLVDFDSDTPEYLAAQAIFGQSPRPEKLAIGRCALPPTLKYQINVTTATASHVYKLNLVGEELVTTNLTMTAGGAALVTSAIANASDSFTVVAHGMATGDGPYRITQAGGVATGLAIDTSYWVIRLTADTFSLASSLANALALTAINITSDGTGNLTLNRSTNDVICAQLIQALNLLQGSPARFSATQVTGAGETDYIEVTGSAAGNWFSLESVEPTILASKLTHADPGVATDLDAINLEQPDWYGLVTLYNSKLYVQAVAAWVEANTKIYIPSLSETESITAVVTNGDTGDALHTSAYTRTAAIYHPSPAAFAGAAWLGSRLPLDPGSDDWKFCQLAGVPAVTLTATQRVNLRAKKMNTVETVAGINITWEGTTADGGFIDNKRGLDFLKDDMTKGVFGALVSNGKTPFTDAGILLVVNEVKASLQRATNMGILTTDTPYVVTFPKSKNVSSSNKALRLLPDIKFACTLAGAVHKVTVSGVVSV